MVLLLGTNRLVLSSSYEHTHEYSMRDDNSAGEGKDPPFSCPLHSSLILESVTFSKSKSIPK